MATTEAGRMEILGKGAGAEMEMSIGATVGGLALIVLGILALDKVAAPILISVGVIVAGVIFLIESVALSSTLVRSFKAEGGTAAVSQISAGMNASMLGGITGVVLGILGILGVASVTLTAVAVIVFGGAALLDYPARTHMRALQMAAQGSDDATRLAMAFASSTNMSGVLVSAGLITLGILALAGTAGEVLVAVSLLGLGTYVFLEGTSLVGYLFSMVS